MNPFRLFNPFHVLRLERENASLIAGIARVEALIDEVVATHKSLPASALAESARKSLLTIADAMAQGRANDAKIMVDAMVLILSKREVD